MRIIDERYHRDLKRHELALRMIAQEVRTHTISDWTGLTRARIRALHRTYTATVGVRRHRGPAPSSLDAIFESAVLRSEAAAVAGICYALGLLSVDSKRRRLPADLTWRERLCDAFELYQHLVPNALLKLEQVILLIGVLSRGAEIALDHCTRCEGAILINRHANQRRLCTTCRRRPRLEAALGETDSASRSKEEAPATRFTEAAQQSLF